MIATKCVRAMLLALGVCLTALPALARSAPQITGAIDESRSVTLFGGVRLETSAKNDRGRVADGLRLDGTQLILKRSPRMEAMFEAKIAELYNPSSPQYHKWMTADQIEQAYGLDQRDIDTVTNWLTRRGFQIDSVGLGGLAISFSGNAGQIRDTFKTEIHNLDVRGVRRFANMTDAKIPAALAPVVAGIVSLNNFPPQMFHEKPMTQAQREQANFGKNHWRATSCSQGGCTFGVTPSDLATIYNLNPLFKSGITGKGQTVVVIENTDVFKPADWKTFRSKLGLSKYKDATFTQTQPSGKTKCGKPGVVDGAEGEAILDAEWASAGAPDANIALMSCADTKTTFGGLIALENLISGSKPPSIISMSYGECEVNSGAAANKAFFTVFKSAAAQGISVFVSSGDNLGALCDPRSPSPSVALHGINVNGWGSTVYNVSVGGTDFGDSYAGQNAKYWNKNNNSNFGSAKSYIPEIPWNDSCASTLTAQFAEGVGAGGNGTTYGAKGFCNTGPSAFITIVGGSGGPSVCAGGSPSIPQVASGGCLGYAKPSWQQNVLGNAPDGVRDLPDVSLFAADPSVWGHTYLFCDSDGKGCTGNPTQWAESGGTSFASPIWAGFQALVNQKLKGKQGNPDPVLYALAGAEYGKKGNAGCNSEKGNQVAKTCVFYDVTAGDNDAPCVLPYYCYYTGGAQDLGVLSFSDEFYEPAFFTGVGWDFATGLGTVNVANLVNKWPKS
ncbi:MAG TPA: S53 family peptidase [Rhizomicrobium sp.]|jgi:subtilase family serine protease